jgi:D-alanyl-D-alanine dipeptidase
MHRPRTEREYLAWLGTIVTSQKAAMLTGAMTAAGFVNYPAEWRHWPYGEQY